MHRLGDTEKTTVRALISLHVYTLWREGDITNLSQDQLRKWIGTREDANIWLRTEGFVPPFFNAFLYTWQCNDCAYILIHFSPYHFKGPSTWVSGYPIADGPRQSPIDIAEASFDGALQPLTLKYDPSNSREILNNGHSFQVTYDDEADTSS